MVKPCKTGPCISPLLSLIDLGLNLKAQSWPPTMGHPKSPNDSLQSAGEPNAKGESMVNCSTFFSRTWPKQVEMKLDIFVPVLPALRFF